MVRSTLTGVAYCSAIRTYGCHAHLGELVHQMAASRVRKVRSRLQRDIVALVVDAAPSPRQLRRPPRALLELARCFLSASRRRFGGCWDQDGDWRVSSSERARLDDVEQQRRALGGAPSDTILDIRPAPQPVLDAPVIPPPA